MAQSGGLRGKRVVVTQAVHQAPELCELLVAAGAEPLLYPCIAIEPPADSTELDARLRTVLAAAYDWLVVTSANTALVLGQRLAAVGVPNGRWPGRGLWWRRWDRPQPQPCVRIWAYPLPWCPTNMWQRDWRRHCWPCWPGQRVLLPQADLARPVLARELAAQGLVVTSVVAYRTTIGSGGVAVGGTLRAGGRRGPDQASTRITLHKPLDASVTCSAAPRAGRRRRPWMATREPRGVVMP